MILTDSTINDVFNWQGNCTISSNTLNSTWKYQSNMPSIVINPGNTCSNLNWTSDNTLEWNYDYNKDFKVEGDIKFNGTSLSERLDRIEERLAILRPNSELEEKWVELKKLGEQYRLLEQDLLEKQKIWDLLNK